MPNVPYVELYDLELDPYEKKIFQKTWLKTYY